MPLYCTDAQLVQHLPPDYGDHISSAVRDAIRLEASEYVDARLAPDYWPFPAVTNTPDTPGIVQTAAHLYAGYLGNLRLHSVGAVEEDSKAMHLLNEAKDIITFLTDPSRSDKGAVPEEAIGAEIMTFGVAPLGANEYRFNPGAIGLKGFHVIRGSVRLSGYQLGVDFDIRLSEMDRAWLFVRYNGAIVDTNTVSYDISYFRHREIDTPGPLVSGGVGGRVSGLLVRE